MDVAADTNCAKPFLRWAGGKKWLIEYMISRIPKNINNYYELFLGSGAVFFSLNVKYRRAYLSDSNKELINAYIQIRDNCSTVIKHLKNFSNTVEDYYYIRDNCTTSSDLTFMAARFIYLNRTCYNGLYRVNSLGKFNVPYGKRRNVDLVTSDNLFLVSKKLKGISIKSCDFETRIKNIKKNDLIFLDPPYTVAHENNGFIEYNQTLFSLEDQMRLCLCIETIKQKGAFYIMTNAKHNKIIEIFAQLDKPAILKRRSSIGGIGACRKQINEYYFTNCN